MKTNTQTKIANANVNDVIDVNTHNNRKQTENIMQQKNMRRTIAQKIITMSALSTAMMVAVAMSLTCSTEGDGVLSADYLRRLNISKNIAAGGWVSVSGGGVSGTALGTSSTSATATLKSGASVEVCAGAASGYVFTGWQGASSSSERCVTVTMDSDRSLTANFAQSRTLTVSRNPTAGGTVTVNDSIATSGSMSYVNGANVRVCATPSEGYVFTGWTGASESVNSCVNISMFQNNSLTANFALLRTLTVTIEPSAGGAVAIDAMSTPGTTTHNNGVTVDVCAVPNSGYTFVGWSGASTSSVTCIKITMNGDRSLTAHFQQSGSSNITFYCPESCSAQTGASRPSHCFLSQVSCELSLQGPGESFTESVNGVSFNMIKVSAGTFMIGCTDADLAIAGECAWNDTPSHQVTLTRDYYIGETEVTQELWTAVMGSNPSWFTGGDNLPVENVSWNMIVNDFLPALNALTGRTYRLPTEAEWEFAARGGNHSQGYIYSGSNNIDDVAWYWSNWGQTNNSTNAVGLKQPNELGIYDMTGNVWEWVHDWYSAYTNTAKTDPTGPSTGSYRVFRGGCWYYGAGIARVSFRYDLYPDYGFSHIGFRLAVSP